MFIYIIVFFLSFFLSIIARKFYNKSNKFAFVIFSLFSILVPAILAGLRTAEIGTDTKGYVATTFFYSTQFNSFFEWLNNSNIEILYSAINYVVANMTNNINWLYFILEFIIICFVYAACFRFDKENKNLFPFYYLTFLLLYYNRSLNMVRQSLALSIFLYSFSYLKEKKFVYYFIFFLLALGFHNSAILMIPIYFIYHFVKNNNKNAFFLFAILVFCSLFYEKIGLFLINCGILNERLVLYFTPSSVRTVLLIELAFNTIVFLMGILFYKKLINENSDNKVLLYFMLLCLVVYSLGFKFSYSQRLSYYFEYLNIFFIPQFINVSKNKYKLNIILKCMFVIALTIYSCVYYGFRKYDETVPYKSILFSESLGG